MSHTHMRPIATKLIGLAAACGLLVANLPALADPSPRVLRVGTWRGIPGQFVTIQAAVDAAHPGDWVLVAPGDWRGEPSGTAGVHISTPGVHLRGMDRNTVIIDGTQRGAACTSDPAAQTITPAGLNGIEVDQASGVSIENLTVCNFLGKEVSLTDLGTSGRQIWFNGGFGSGRIGMHAYTGRYLTATSTYYKDTSSPTALLGLFVDNADGPGLWQHVYSTNMGIVAIWLSACRDCNATIDDAHATHSPLGLFAKNAGGHLVLQNSELDHNVLGVGLGSENGQGAPSPQEGACPGGSTSPLIETTSCTLIWHNHIHDNNDTSVPRFGAVAPPPGIGVLVSGGNNDTIRENLVDHHGAWGIAVVAYPDPGNSAQSHCAGGTVAVGRPDGDGAVVCYFEASGNQVLDNRLADNGSYGNTGNGDLASGSASVVPGNCFQGNTDSAGLTSDPPAIQTLDGTCGGPSLAGSDLRLALGLACGGQLAQAGGARSEVSCGGVPLLTSYPALSTPTMPDAPPQPTMPDPCARVPENPWC